MTSNKLEQLFVRLQKARIILLEEGWGALWSRICEKTTRRQPDQREWVEKRRSSNSRKVPFWGRKLKTDKLTQRLSKEIAGRKFSLAISQDDFATVVGGVQSTISREQKALNQHGIALLHIFPYLAEECLEYGTQTPVVGVSVDGKRVGFADGKELVNAVSGLAVENLLEVNIHHTMGHHLGFIQELMDRCQPVRAVFWVHDFFSVCPGYLLLRNNLQYCGAPSGDSNSCQICVYGIERKKHHQAFLEFLNNNRLEIRAPSQFAMNLWSETFPTPDLPKQVEPHVSLEWEADVPMPLPADRQPLRIAFVGRPVFHKGFSTWTRITKLFHMDERYQFFLASSNSVKSRNFNRLPLSSVSQSANPMVAALIAGRVDVALLWSICPETFSYTLFESLSAGCFILTNPNSGNIQAYIREHPERGVVLEDEKSMIRLLGEGGLVSAVAEYQRHGKPRATVIANPRTFSIPEKRSIN